MLFSRRLANLPIAVVLPLPCNPTSIKVAGFPFKFRGLLSPPSNSISSSFTIFTNKSPGLILITEDNISEVMREVRLALLEADVNYKVVKEFTNNVKEKAGIIICGCCSPKVMLGFKLVSVFKKL